MNHSFNLISEAWIPVVDLQGHAQNVSLTEVLKNATQYRNLSAKFPHTNAALMRLLLAVLHRVFGPKDSTVWQALWQKSQFDAGQLAAYLESPPIRAGFDLFSPERPFFQHRHPLATPKPIQDLLQIIGGGDTFSLFDHCMDDTQYVLQPAEAALMLLTAQSFGLAGICHPKHKLYYTDAPCSRAIVFFVEGQNLFETLMFNLVAYNRATPIPWAAAGDALVWEVQDPYVPARTHPNGYLDFLTWPNRKIMLIPQEVDGRTVVSQLTTAPGLVLDAEFHNPMYHYRLSEEKGNLVAKFLRFSEDKALWRDSYSLLTPSKNVVEPPRVVDWARELVNEGILPQRRLRVAAYGMCTEPGKQKVNFYRGDSFEMDNRLLQDNNLVSTLETGLAHAEALRSELWKSLYQLAAYVISFDNDKEESFKPDPKDIKNLVEHWDAEGMYWSKLEYTFHSFLDQLPDNPQQALDTWHMHLRRSALDAFQQAVDGLGGSYKALKAGAKTRGILTSGIKKVLGTINQEG